MLSRVFHTLAILLALGTSAAVYGAPTNAGQEDMDKATEKKMTAETLADLGDVVRLVESALQKGLDEPNTALAKTLLVSTLLERGKELARHIVSASSVQEAEQRRLAALADLDKAVKIDPKLGAAHLLIARLNLVSEQSNLKEVRAMLDKAIECSGEDPATRAEALTLRSKMQDDFDKKIADLNEAVRLLPDDPNVIRDRGLALADAEKYEPALADLNKAIELDPDNGPTYEVKAIVLARVNKLDEALKVLEKARQLSPLSTKPLMQQARIHVQQQRLDAAINDLTEALKMDPKNVTILLLRASIYQETGAKEKAMADVDATLRLRPSLPIAIRSRALLLAEDKRYDEAAQELEKLLQVDPNDSLAMLQLGMLYSTQKKSAQAIPLYDRFLAEHPDQWQALRGRADAYLNIGRQPEAIADYEKAFKLHPEDESLLNNFAWVLATSPDEKLRDGRRAIQIASKAAELTGHKEAYILSTLAAAYAEVGDFDNAVKWATKAVSLDDKKHDESLRKELESYQAKKAWREVLSESAEPEKK